MMKKLRVLGVAAGQGPLLFPLKRYVVGNIEPRGCFHTKNEEQWKINFGDIPFVKKIEDFNYNGRVDVIISHPDCGSSSMLRHSRVKTEGKPKENPSMQLFIQSINHFKPKVFVMENLPKLLTKIPQNEWAEYFPDYNIIYHCYSVAEYGNSQVNRKRLLMIGERKKYKNKYLDHFRMVYQVNTPKTTSELLQIAKTYPEKDMKLSKERNLVLYDYRNPKNKEKQKVWLSHDEIKELWGSPYNGKGRWPVHTPTMQNLPGVYRNLPHKYPNTLLKNPRQFRPDGRPLTINDFRAIQGFSPKFKIYRDNENPHYWFSKAIVTITKGPVWEMGEWFKICLLKAWN